MITAGLVTSCAHASNACAIETAAAIMLSNAAGNLSVSIIISYRGYSVAAGGGGLIVILCRVNHSQNEQVEQQAERPADRCAKNEYLQ